jgi:uncharacterized protein YjbI with pentapeptide repeats
MSDEQHVPKWGDPIESIPEERRKELMRLHDEQVRWLRKTNSDGNPADSPFAEAARSQEKPNLNGAEVFFLWRAIVTGPRTELHLEGAYLSFAHLAGASLSDAHLDGADLSDSLLQGANLSYSYLRSATFYQAHLERAQLIHANLQAASLCDAHLEGARLLNADLRDARMQGAFMSTATSLDGAVVTGGSHDMPSVADVRWENVNLAVVQEWPEKPVLGDERMARELEKTWRTQPPSSVPPSPPNAARLDDGWSSLGRGRMKSAFGAYGCFFTSAEFSQKISPT